MSSKSSLSSQETSESPSASHGDTTSSDSSTSLEETSEAAVVWELEDVRHHWTLLAHCDALIFPNVYPPLTFTSELSAMLWHFQRKSVQPSRAIVRDLSQCATYTLRKITLMRQQIEQFVFCDILLDIEWLDFASRKSFLENLGDFLSLQIGLSVVNFENAQLKRKEGMEVLMALGDGSVRTLKQLFMWHMFHPDENPVLLDTTFCKYRDKGAFKASSTCKISFWRTLVRFRHLSILAINYAYLSDVDGHTLCMLASVLTGRLRELKLLCEERDSPYPSKANDFDGRFKIPDSSWDLALQYCPKLNVHMVFVAMPLYELVTAFMSQSIPLCKLYISSGIQIGRTEKEPHVGCILKTIINWYSNTLDTLIIHLWHNRELLDGILLKVLDNMPLLSTFEFSGVLYRDSTMKNICQKIRDGHYPKLKIIRIRLQRLGEPPRHFEDSEQVQASLMNDMETIARKYRKVLKERNIKMDLGTYPI